MEPLLDIHTHRPPVKAGTAIINCPANHFAPQAGQYYSVGIHPWDAERPCGMELLRSIATHPQVLAIGEAGLDKAKESGLNLQFSLFREQIELSELLQKPLIIHCVKATAEVIALRKQMRPAQPWIIHGFRGKPQQAQQWLQAGVYLSTGVRFNAEAVATIPTDRLFVETDEDDSTIHENIAQVSQAIGITPERLTQIVTQNIKTVFRL